MMIQLIGFQCTIVLYRFAVIMSQGTIERCKLDM